MQKADTEKNALIKESKGKFSLSFSASDFQHLVKMNKVGFYILLNIQKQPVLLLEL